MSSFPTYKYDIFISYASVDNLTTQDIKQGWVDRFKENLEISLSKRVGRIGAVKIWWGPVVRGNQVFDNTIKDAIDASKLFIALTSNGYMASDYCKKELDWFYQKAKKESIGLTIGDCSRIFNVLLNNIHHENWLREFVGTSGFPMNDATDANIFGEPSDPGTDLFKKQLRKLVDSIFDLLIKFKEISSEEKPADEAVTTIDSSKSPIIFIADVADSLSQIKERIKNDLLPKGIKVTSDVPPPYSAPDHKNSVITHLKSSLLSVHLLDHLPGRKIEGEPGKTYPQKQVELAKQLKTPQFIWVPDYLDIDNIEDVTHKNFLYNLKTEERKKDTYDFIQGLESSITRDLLEKISLLKQPPKRSPLECSVLLDTHLKDQMCAFRLGQYLIDKGIQPFINQENGGPKSNVNLFEERLKQVSVLIIFYGSVAEEWVRERVNSVFQFAAKQYIITKQCNLKSIGIVLTPPKKSVETIHLEQSLFRIHLIDNSQCEDIDTKLLTPLFENLNWGVKL